MDELLFESLTEYELSDLTAIPTIHNPNERPLTYGDLLAMVNPILTRLDRMETILNNVYSRQDIDRMVAERNQAIADSEQRQYKYIEKVLNEVGKRFEDTVNGLAKQIAGLTDRVGDVIRANDETARLSKDAAILNQQNAQLLAGWSGILQTEQAQNAELRQDVGTLQSDMRRTLDNEHEMDERMNLVVTRTNANAEAIAELRLSSSTVLASFTPVQAYIQRQQARRDMWTTFGRNLASIVKSPRGLAIIVGWGAWLTGLETGTVQELVKQLVQLLGG